MKQALTATYAIISYAIGFIALIYWIASTGNLLPFASIDGMPNMNTIPALIKNIALILLFGLQHSVMARKSFKKWITRVIPEYLERSTYVLSTGLVLTLLVWEWEPLGGTLWRITNESAWYYILYGLYFFGWVILFISTFLINHFDLFGLRQAYLSILGIPYEEIDFKVVSFYKYTRHPLYLGALIGIWATPSMTVTHLVYALLLTGYIYVGIFYEERDLISAFGDKYRNYIANTSKLIPIKKFLRRS